MTHTTIDFTEHFRTPELVAADPFAVVDTRLALMANRNRANEADKLRQCATNERRIAELAGIE